MLNSFATQNRRNAAFSLLFAVLASPAAHASLLAETPDCSVSGDSLQCHLLQILHILYILAGILTLVLIVVIAIALRIYSRNKSRNKTRKQVRP